MRKLIVWAFMYSLDGLLADDDTEYWRFCFCLPAERVQQRFVTLHYRRRR